MTTTTEKGVEKALPILPAYVWRPVLNSAEVIAWARSMGFESTIDGAELHLTVAASRSAIAWNAAELDRSPYVTMGPMPVEELGEGAKALMLPEDDYLMRRWGHYRDLGASWDFPAYRPHVTLTYADAPSPLPAPYPGRLLLGPENIAPFRDNPDAPVEKACAPSATEGEETITINCAILKADEEQRMVYGWASVIEKGGEVYTDLQGDQIDPDTMHRAWIEFMRHERAAKAMHHGQDRGQVLFAMPLTRDIQKAFGLECDRAGVAVGVYVDDDEALAKAKSGEFTGFSIGATAQREDV